MTVALATTPVPSRARHRLVDLARGDMASALDLVVPFVLAHPAEAGVLVELGAIASRSEREWRSFRRALRVLFAAVEA